MRAQTLRSRPDAQALKSALPKLESLEPTEVFDTYWKFAVRRQEILMRRVRGDRSPWTDDPVLKQYRFTNAYRVCDRVSQYLIRNVIYSEGYSETDTIFRILLMKTFNRIDTWELLNQCLGSIEYSTFDECRYGEVLTEARSCGARIYSPAYIMPSVGSVFGYKEKHRNHLSLIRRIIESGFVSSIKRASGLQEVYDLLRSYPGLGPFLAFQYTIDLNYSDVIDFDENEFVVAGPGALDGISKCFSNTEGVSAEQIIAAVTVSQEKEFAKRGLQFPLLGRRWLHLIDCQNLFCEISKYARVAHPQAEGLSGRTRIKQSFHPLKKPVILSFPPKWHIDLSWEVGSGEEAEWNESLFR